MRWLVLFAGLFTASLQGCSHTDGQLFMEAPQAQSARTECGSAAARIWALIAKGQFAEAQVLIAQGTAGGLVSQELAARMLQRISVLNTKLREIPASLQRVRNFPSRLRDYTLFEIKSMLDTKDFSVATQAQLQMARKLIEEESRLMQK